MDESDGIFDCMYKAMPMGFTAANQNQAPNWQSKKFQITWKKEAYNQQPKCDKVFQYKCQKRLKRKWDIFFEASWSWIDMTKFHNFKNQRKIHFDVWNIK